MSAEDLRRKSETDWERVDATADDDTDLDDIPPLDETFFARAELYVPGKKMCNAPDTDDDVLK